MLPKGLRKMKSVYQNIIALAAATLVVVGVSYAYKASARVPHAGAPAVAADTLIVNTSAMARDVIGFNDRTPLEIKLVDGVIVAVKALPNQETPGFFRRVLESPIFTAPIGKTPAQVLQMHFDAVSGATYSSEAVIENLKRGLKSVAE